MSGESGIDRRDVLPLARRPALWVGICFIFGITLHRIVPHWPVVWLGGAILLAAVGGALIFAARPSCWALMAALVCAGLALAQVESYFYPVDHISAYATDRPRLAWVELHVDYEPRVLSDPLNARPLPPKQVLTASVRRVKTWDGWEDARGQLLVQIAQPNPRLGVNQIIRVVGKLERPAPAMNPGQFDWANYYREQRILTSLQVAQAQNVTIIGTSRASPLDWLRARSRQLLAEGFGAEQTLDHALLRALLLGDNDPELRDLQEQFRRTGTSHHLSISGMHIAVLGGFVYGICRLFRVRPRWSVLVLLGFVLVYGLAALPSPPVVRSVLLCLFFGVGVLGRRTRDPVQLLALSVFAMLIYQPLDLYNAGFQLSFGTVLALMIFSRPFVQFMHGIAGEELVSTYGKLPLMSRLSGRIHGGFKDAFYVGVVCWVVSLPLVVFHFNQLNPWAIVCGIVLAPFVFLSLVGALSKVVLTLLWPSLAGVWAAWAAAPSALMRWVLEWLSKIPGSEYPIPSMPLWVLLAIYCFYLLWLIPTPRPKLRLVVRSIPVAACTIGVSLPLWRPGVVIPRDELKLTLLSLGAGQCAVLESPSGRTMLIDCGSTSMSDPLAKCIGPYLRATQRTSIDLILLTHSDFDHISAAATVAQVYDVREVLIGARFKDHARTNPWAANLLRTLEQMDLPPRVLQPQQRIPLGRDAELEILWPPPERPALSSNDSAVVAQVRYAGRSILLTGDIQELAQRELLKESERLRADVLLAPHHGSSEDSTAAFIRAVNPQFVLSSNDRTLTGKQRRLDKIVGQAQLYRTHRDGAITVHIDKNGTLRVETFKSPAE